MRYALWSTKFEIRIDSNNGGRTTTFLRRGGGQHHPRVSVGAIQIVEFRQKQAITATSVDARQQVAREGG